MRAQRFWLDNCAPWTKFAPHSFDVTCCHFLRLIGLLNGRDICGYVEDTSNWCLWYICDQSCRLGQLLKFHKALNFGCQLSTFSSNPLRRIILSCILFYKCLFIPTLPNDGDSSFFNRCLTLTLTTLSKPTLRLNTHRTTALLSNSCEPIGFVLIYHKVPLAMQTLSVLEQDLLQEQIVEYVTIALYLKLLLWTACNNNTYSMEEYVSDVLWRVETVLISGTYRFRYLKNILGLIRCLLTTAFLCELLSHATSPHKGISSDHQLNGEWSEGSTPTSDRARFLN